MALARQRVRLWLRPRKREPVARRVRAIAEHARRRSGGGEHRHSRPFHGQLSRARNAAPDGAAPRPCLSENQRRDAGCARRGAIDPKVEPYKSRLAAENVSVFDLTDIQSTDAANHYKFLQSPELVRLVGDRLARGQTLSDFRQSVVDRLLARTANGVGALERAVEQAETPEVQNPL